MQFSLNITRILFLNAISKYSSAIYGEMYVIPEYYKTINLRIINRFDPVQWIIHFSMRMLLFQ